MHLKFNIKPGVLLEVDHMSGATFRDPAFIDRTRVGVSPKVTMKTKIITKTTRNQLESQNLTSGCFRVKLKLIYILYWYYYKFKAKPSTHFNAKPKASLPFQLLIWETIPAERFTLHVWNLLDKIFNLLSIDLCSRRYTRCFVTRGSATSPRKLGFTHLRERDAHGAMSGGSATDMTRLRFSGSGRVGCLCK